MNRLYRRPRGGTHMRKTCHVYLRLAALIATLVVPFAGAQEKFPARPIEMIIPTPAGGGTDITMRKLAAIAEHSLGQKVVVINKPGAVGTVGVNALVTAKK